MPQAVAITEVWIDSRRRLCARTAESFDQIYRTAMEVHWDPDGFLYSPPPREWSYARWLQQFRDAVRSEYNRELVVTTGTSWRDVDSVLRRELEQVLLQG
jgi:hypothetical protein